MPRLTISFGVTRTKASRPGSAFQASATSIIGVAGIAEVREIGLAQAVGTLFHCTRRCRG